jgi:hypothetical protein
MQVGAAILALIRSLNVIHHLNLGSAIIAAGYQVEFRLDSSPGTLLTRRGFWLSFPVGIHISGLAIFSRHFSSSKTWRASA